MTGFVGSWSSFHTLSWVFSGLQRSSGVKELELNGSHDWSLNDGDRSLITSTLILVGRIQDVKVPVDLKEL